jgi:hypothetical protein
VCIITHLVASPLRREFEGMKHAGAGNVHDVARTFGLTGAQGASRELARRARVDHRYRIPAA